MRAKLDEQGMTIAGNQEASLKSRRQLADITKSALPTAPWPNPHSRERLPVPQTPYSSWKFPALTPVLWRGLPCPHLSLVAEASVPDDPV